MTKPNFTRMICLLCISVAVTACKEKTEIIEAIRSIKTITVREQAAEQIRKLSGSSPPSIPPISVFRSQVRLSPLKLI